MKREPKEHLCSEAILAHHRHLVATSISRRAAAQATIDATRAVINECRTTCGTISLPNESRVNISVTTLLRALPVQGWMPGSGRYAHLLHNLLDSNSTLIEERIFATGSADEEWQVRLTERGWEERLQCDAEDCIYHM